MDSWMIYLTTDISAAYSGKVNDSVTSNSWNRSSSCSTIGRVENGTGLLDGNTSFDLYWRVRVALNLVHSPSPSLNVILCPFNNDYTEFSSSICGVLTLLQIEFMGRSFNFSLSIQLSPNKSNDGCSVENTTHFSINSLTVKPQCIQHALFNIPSDALCAAYMCYVGSDVQ